MKIGRAIKKELIKSICCFNEEAYFDCIKVTDNMKALYTSDGSR